MLSAPAAMPALMEVGFGVGLAAPDRIRGGPGTPRAPRAGSTPPVCAASSITGTSPAHDTRFSSSNSAAPCHQLWDDLTESVLPIRINQVLNKPDYCRSKCTFLISSPFTDQTDPWIQA